MKRLTDKQVAELGKFVAGDYVKSGALRPLKQRRLISDHVGRYVNIDECTSCGLRLTVERIEEKK